MKLLLPLLAVAIATAVSPLRADTLPRWHFVPGTGFDYQVEQHTTIDTEDGGTSVTHANGTIKMAAGKTPSGTRAALLEMDLRIYESIIRGEVMTPDDVKNLPPVKYRAYLSPDGTLAPGSASDPTNLQLLLDLTFPLPDKAFSAANPVTETLSMQSSGNLTKLEGEATYTYGGHKTIDGVKYLAFTVDCKLESPPGLPPAPFEPDPPKAAVDATIECLFDEEQGFFYRVKNTMTMKVSMAAPKNPAHRNKLVQSQVVTVQIVEPSEGG